MPWIKLSSICRTFYKVQGGKQKLLYSSGKNTTE